MQAELAESGGTRIEAPMALLLLLKPSLVSYGGETVIAFAQQ